MVRHSHLHHCHLAGCLPSHYIISHQIASVVHQRYPSDNLSVAPICMSKHLHDIHRLENISNKTVWKLKHFWQHEYSIWLPILTAVSMFILYCFCYILCIIQNGCKHNRVHPAAATASEVWPLLGNLNPHSASGHFRLTGGIYWCGSTLLSVNEG